MMNATADLMRRRGQIQERIAAQRERLAVDSAPLIGGLARADRLLMKAKNALIAVKARPYFVTAAIASVFVFRPRRLWRVARWGWTAWRLAGWWSGSGR